MRILIWEVKEGDLRRHTIGFTTRHHDGGALVVVARDVQTARQYIRAMQVQHEEAVEEMDYLLEHPIRHDWEIPDPTYNFPIAGKTVPMVRVYEDSGCC